MHTRSPECGDAARSMSASGSHSSKCGDAKWSRRVDHWHIAGVATGHRAKCTVKSARGLRLVGIHRRGMRPGSCANQAALDLRAVHRAIAEHVAAVRKALLRAVSRLVNGGRGGHGKGRRRHQTRANGRTALHGQVHYSAFCPGAWAGTQATMV